MTLETLQQQGFFVNCNVLLKQFTMSNLQQPQQEIWKDIPGFRNKFRKDKNP